MKPTEPGIRKERWTTVDADRYHRRTGSYADRVDAEFVETVARGRDGRALDMPCGSGRMNAVLSPHLSTFGADYSVPMLEFAVHQSGVRGVRADAFRLAFRDDAFEVVVCLRLTFHYADCSGILSELARVTEPGGAVVVDSLNRFSFRWLISGLWNMYRRNRDRGVVFRSPAAFERAVEQAGLRVVRRESRYLLPTRMYRLLPGWACAGLTACERVAPARLRVLTFWHLEKPMPSSS